nr:LysM domain-containing protein [Streptomyces specialis]
MSARGRHRRQRVRRTSRISLMLTAGGAGVALPLLAPGGASAAPPAAQRAPAATAAPAPPPAGSDHRDDADRSDRSDRSGEYRTYTVVKGDSLSGIADAEDVDGGWERLYEDNRQVIGGDPDLIHPGQELSPVSSNHLPLPNKRVV